VPKTVALAVASCFASGLAFANPNGFSVVNGQVFFSYNGNVLNVTNSPGSIINWQGFSIGANEITRFIQQSASSTVLNRVVGVDPSIILGALQSNGRVFLINPNGVVFGAGAKVDVAGLVASTLNLSNADFLAGRARFTETPGAGNVVNQGTITTPSGGQVYLIAPNVQNHGIINSPQGEVILAAGKTVEIVDSGTPNLRVELTASDNEALNVGKIVANSGKIGIYAGLIKNSGEVRADGVVVGANGEILLKAVKNVAIDKGSIVSASGPTAGKITIQADTGTVTVGGTVEANAAQGKGGAISVAGQQGVNVEQGGRISANGSEGGSVALSSAAGNVSVAGIITADASAGRAGTVSLIAANAALLAAGGQLSASGGAGGGLVTTKSGSGVTFELGSSVQASGGSVIVVADAGGFSGQGTIDVSGIDGNGGNVNIATRSDITLADESRILAGGRAGGDVRIESTEGTLLASGLIDGQGSNGPGGKVYLLAPRVALIRRALIDVSGATGGGIALVGGDYQGANSLIQNASRAYFGADAIIRADAVTSGNGGKVVVWSDDGTQAYGNISARGGALSGNGGLVETSGKAWLDFAAMVDTSAPHGAFGTLLLDPKNLDVDDVGSPYSFGVNNLFANNASGNSVITASSINSQISDVVLQANNDITFTSAVNIANAGTKLTARAGRSIIVNNNIQTTNGDIALIANDTVANGVVAFDRDPGAATIAMAPGTVISAGTGDVYVKMGQGTGHAGASTSGDMVLSSITGRDMFIEHNGILSSSSILMADAASVITARSVVFDLFNSGGLGGGGGGIGALTMPIKVATNPVFGTSINLEAHTHISTGGVYIESADNMTIGGAVLFAGSVKGVQTLSGGPIKLMAAGTLTTLAGTADCTMAGTGGPVCSADYVTLQANSLNINNVVRSGTYMQLYANNMSLNADLTAVNGSVNLIPLNFSGTDINLGGADGAGVLGLSAAELNHVHLLNSAETVQIGDPLFGGDITVSAALTSGAGGGTQNFQNLKLNSGSGNTIDINAPVTVGNSLHLETGGEIRQTAAGVITVPNLLAVSANNDVRLDTANNLVGTVAGHAVGNFLFKNSQSLTVGSVLGTDGITVDGAEGSPSSAVITLTGAGSMLTVNRTISVNSENINDTSATITLTAPAGIHISGDGGESTIGLFAYGGYGYNLNGQPATITLNGGSGPVVIDNAASIVADGGDGGTLGGGPGGAGTASVTINTTGQVSITGNSFVGAYGGYADFSTSNNGANATLAINSGAAGISIDGAEGFVWGGNSGGIGGNGGLGSIALNAGGGQIKLDNSAVLPNSTNLTAYSGYGTNGAGGDAVISLTNASSIVIDRNSYIYADAAFGSIAGGNASVTLTNSAIAPGATGIFLDRGSSIEAWSGDSNDLAGSATITLNAGGGKIVLDNGAYVDAYGRSAIYVGGSASILVTNASGLTLSNGSDLYAEGGGGFDGGGAASVTVTTSGATGINLNSGAYIQARGGHGGDGGEGSAAGGNATVNLTANGAGGINLAGGNVYADGGGAYYNGGNAEINLTTTGTGAILVSGGGRVEARGGHGGDGGENFATGNGGNATITLLSHGGISIVGSGSGVNAYGGGGGVSSQDGNGGNATVNLNNIGAAGITIDGGEGFAQGGNAGFSFGGGGNGTLSLDGGSGPIIVMNGARARAFGGGSNDFFYGGEADVSFTTSGGISVLTSVVTATGGPGSSYRGEADVNLNSSGAAGISITSSTVAASGDEGADVTITTTGGAITVNNATISVDGAEGTGIGFNAAGAITIGNSVLSATSSENSASVNVQSGGLLSIDSSSNMFAQGFDYARVTLQGGGGVSVTASSIGAKTSSFGNADVVITATGGHVNLLNSSIMIDDGAGGHIYDGNVAITAATGNVDIAGTTLIKVLGDGGEGSVGANISISAANGYIHGGTASMLQANNVNFTNDPTIQLTAKHGIGAIGSPIRISDDQPVGHITNTTSGDIVLAQVNGSTSIDNVADVINTAVNGGLDFTVENGSIVLTNNTVFSANGAGKVGLHALGAGNSIQIDAGSRVVTNGGTATLQADNIILSGTPNQVSAGASGVVALQAGSAGQVIDLGGSNGAGTLGIDSTSLASINAGTLRIGDGMSMGGIHISGADVSAINNLSLVTGGNITQSGALMANNLALTSSGNVTLNDVTNSVGYVAADLLTGTGSLSFTATGFNVAGAAIDGVSGVKTNGGNITLTSPNVGQGIFVVSSGPGYTIDTSTTGGTVTINSADWLVVNDFADIRGAQVNLNSTHPLGVALGQIRIDATGTSPTAVNINASAPAGTVISSADIYSAGGISINAGGYIELDSHSNGSTIAATGPVNITAGTSISAYGSSPASAWMQVTGSTVTMDAGTFINLGSVTGHGLRATSGNVNISAVDSIGGLTPGAMKGSIVADNGNVLISVTGPGGFFDSGGSILATNGSITLDNGSGGAIGGSISIQGPVSTNGSVILKANDFINLGSGGVFGGGGVVVHSGATLFSSGVIEAPTINLASVGGMSAVVRNAGAGVTATNSGGGDLIISADALTPVFTVGAGGASFSNTGGSGYYINAANNMNLNGGTADDTYARFAAGGTLTTNGYTNASGFGTLFAANNVVFSGAATNVGGALGVIGGVVDVNTSVMGDTVNVTAGALNVAGGDFKSMAGDFTGTIAGNVAVSAGGRIYGDPDVRLTVGGNILINGAGSKIEAASASSVHVLFPLLTEGGYIINGQPGVVWDPVTNTGFFAGGFPAALGKGFFVEYGVIPIEGLVPAVVSAINSAIDSTNKSNPSTERDKDKDKDKEKTADAGTGSGAGKVELQCN
jgi:filamentous hemagglutinin family protein